MENHHGFPASYCLLLLEEFTEIMWLANLTNLQYKSTRKFPKLKIKTLTRTKKKRHTHIYQKRGEKSSTQSAMIPWKKGNPPQTTQPTPPQPCPIPATSAGRFGFGRRLRDLRLRCRLRARQELGEAGHGLGRWEGGKVMAQLWPSPSEMVLSNLQELVEKSPQNQLVRVFFRT